MFVYVYISMFVGLFYTVTLLGYKKY